MEEFIRQVAAPAGDLDEANSLLQWNALEQHTGNTNSESKSTSEPYWHTQPHDAAETQESQISSQSSDLSVGVGMNIELDKKITKIQISFEYNGSRS